MRRIKLRTVVNAIRKNGYPKIRGQFTSRKWNRETFQYEISGGCAIGQAAINLGGVDASTLSANMPNVVARAIVHMNDHTPLSLPEIADGIEEKYAWLMDEWVALP
jgi:hypothetical protein